MKNRIFISLLAIFLLVSASGCMRNDENEAMDSDEYAADFILKDLNGNSVSLSDYSGKIVVLNFWASWCPPCRQEMPDLDEFDRELRMGDDVVFFAINLTDGQRETAADVRQFINDNGYGFTVLLDEQGLLADRYNINSIPQTFVLDRNGNTSASIIGATTKEAILAKVDAIK